MDATQPTERRYATGTWTIALVVLLLLCASAAVTACGGSSTTALNSPSATITSPTASPSIIPAAEPVSRWDAPGSASLAQTLAVTHRRAAALHAETMPKADLYAAAATWDYQANDTHVQGAKEIEGVYRDAGAYIDWSKRSHFLAAPGVGVNEGVFTVYGTDSTPGLSLLAVDANKIVHEEVFVNEGTGRPVTYYGSAPGPKDTAKVAAQVGAAVGEAFASGDQAALQALVAPDILFRDAAQPHGVRGWDALLAWWDKVPTVTLENKKQISGPGWAVGRWTIRQVFSTGVELAMPGASVMEVRNGKVVRMTLYYNSSVMRLQM
jgi:hypothetical protein